MEVDNRNYGGWIQTYEGRVFYPINPRVQDFSVHDIAHSHALVCRWAGHTRQHYPLAQHEVLASYMVPKHRALEALVHDNPEAYIADLARPIKVEIPQYNVIEGRLADAGAGFFGVPYKMSPEVKWADDVLLCSEKRDLMRKVDKTWTAPMPPERLPFKIRPWPIWYAELRWLLRYRELTGKPVIRRYLKNKLEDWIEWCRPMRLETA